MIEDNEEIERKLSYTYHSGAAQSLEDSAIETRRMAGFEFSQGNDKQAETLRRFAVWLENRAMDCRKTQKKYEKQFSGGI